MGKGMWGKSSAKKRNSSQSIVVSYSARISHTIIKKEPGGVKKMVECLMKY